MKATSKTGMNLAVAMLTVIALILSIHIVSAHTNVGRIGIFRAGQRINSERVSPDSTGVQPGQQTLVAGYMEYDTSTCAEISSGNWSVNTAPSYGTTSPGTVSISDAPPGCPEATYTFGVIYYTPNTGVTATTDSFTATWSTLDGEYYDQATYTINIAAPAFAKNNGNCKCTSRGVADPIDASTGNMYEQAIDYSTAGPNQLAFIRSYNSTTSSNIKAAALGGYWRSNYDRYLTINGTTATAERADGRVVSFTQTGGTWVPDSDVDIALTNSSNIWVLTDHDDTVETYVETSTGTLQLASITVRGGYTQKLSYNSSGQLASVKDTYGRALAFSYSGTLITSLTTPDATTLTYGYGSSGTNGTALDQLDTVTYPTKATLTYVYENSTYPFELTGIIDERGNRYATWGYDSYNRAISSQHAGGADLTTIAYTVDSDNDISSSTITNALGQQQTETFTVLQGAPKLTKINRLATSTTAAATRTFTYDANGYLASSTDWNGVVTDYTNDARGLPVKVTEAAGTAVARTTQTTWATDFHVPVSVSTQGLTQTFGYDSFGNPVSRTDVGSSAQKRSWAYVWQDAHLISVTGPRTDLTQKTTFSYGSFGQLASITDALGHKTAIAKSTVGGLPLTIVDPNSVTTSLTYDARQQLTSSTIVTTKGKLTIDYGHDAAEEVTTTLLPDGSYFHYAYDQAHRLTALSDADSNLMVSTLDDLGDRTATSVAKSGSAIVWHEGQTFDALGRLIIHTAGAGQKTQLAYDNNGNIITVTDPLKHATRLLHDALGRIAKETNPASGNTSFTYDAHDRILKAVAPNSAITTFSYDGLGRLLQRVSPDTGTTAYGYDPADNLLQTKDASAIVTNHSYDALNRISSTAYPANTAENVTYIYDQAGHGAGIGHLTSMKDAVGTVSYTYDQRGNELTEARVSSGVTLTTGYAYDAASRIASITYPSGTIAAYSRDKAGKITAVSAVLAGTTSATAIVSDVSYLPFGPPTALTYGSGLSESRSYDKAYRLATLATGTVQGLSYTYDAADNVLAIADADGGNSQKLGYDVLNRLTGATGAYGTYGWTYDAAGNRLSQTVKGGSSTQYSYGSAGNLLTSLVSGSSTTSVSTSAAGNIIALATTGGNASSFTFDKAERLSAVTTNGTQVASYTYDASGHRFAKTLPTGGSRFQYDQISRLLEETDSSGKLKTDTIYLNDMPIADVTPSSVYFLHTDHLGTPQVATTTQKAVAWRAIYQPFGINSGGDGLLTQNIRFPGQYDDAETGYYQNGFRDYNPAWGRYLESDPIGLAGGINTFAYVGGNPLKRLDPTGRDYIGESLGSLKQIPGDLSNLAQDFYNDPLGTLESLGPTFAGLGMSSPAADLGFCPQAAEETGSALPSTLARVIPGVGPYPTFGLPGAADVFVTTPEAIEGLDAAGIAERLTIDPADQFTVIQFPTPEEGLASPVFRSNSGFVGGGYTAGGAPEFVIPNGPIPPGATTTIVGPTP